MLVRLASEPVPSVTHDAALGDLEVRGWPIDEWLVQACAYAVLRGKSMNVYLSVGDEMIVALTPIEGARALYLLWQRGRTPELPNEEYWMFFEDGLAMNNGTETPVGLSDGAFFWARIRRQRRAAGLA